MRTLFYMIIAFIMSIGTAHAQRMLPGGRGIEMTAGTLSAKVIGDDFYASLGMTITGKKGNYQLYALEYSRQQYDYNGNAIPHESFTAQGGYSFYLLGDPGRTIALHAALSGVAGYEHINGGKATLPDGALLRTENKFIYGGAGRLSLETYLSDRIVFLVQGRAQMLWGTSLQQFRPSWGVGLRFNF